MPTRSAPPAEAQKSALFDVAPILPAASRRSGATVVYNYEMSIELANYYDAYVFVLIVYRQDAFSPQRRLISRTSYEFNRTSLLYLQEGTNIPRLVADMCVQVARTASPFLDVPSFLTFLREFLVRQVRERGSILSTYPESPTYVVERVLKELVPESMRENVMECMH